jgi:hypothetical protein
MIRVGWQPVIVSLYDPHHVLIWFSYAGSINNIDDTEYKCLDGTVPDVRNKVISGVVGASSSGTSIQVANLLRLFKIPQVPIYTKDRSWWTTAQNDSHTFSYRFPSSRRVPSWATSSALNISRGPFHLIITRWWPSSRWSASSNGPTFPSSTKNPLTASR